MTASLGPIREVWAHRSRARSRGDRAYLLYVVAMTVLVVGVPLLLSTGRALARPDVMVLLQRPEAPAAATALALAATAMLVGVGALRGPALLPPFFTATLASGPLPRRTVLRRPFARALALPLLAAVVPAGLVTATLLAAGAFTAERVATLLLAALGTGLLWGSAWSAGQLLRPTGRRILVLVLGAAAVIVAGGLRGGAAEMWPVLPLAGAAGLAIAGVSGVAVCGTQLDRLRGVELAAQAARWEAATTTATTMDLAGAAGAFRAVPSAARRLGAIGAGPLPALYARRDAVAWLRTPDRSAAGVLGTLLGAAAIGGATLLAGPVGVVVLAFGTLLLVGASGAFLDGMRHAVDTLGAPPLLGQRAATQMILHSLAPLLLLVVLAVLGGLGVTLLTGAGVASEVAAAGARTVLLPVAVAVPVLAARAWDAAKGTMPLSLATPIPTPQGDLSVLVMLAWQADGILVPLLAAALLLAVLPLGPLVVLGVAAALAVLLALLTARRLRALES